MPWSIGRDGIGTITVQTRAGFLTGQAGG